MRAYASRYLISGSGACSAGFTLIEILVVVVIIGIITTGVLLSVTLTGRDRELERESDRLLSLVNYAREQAEVQTREYGVIFHDDGYQFVAYDPRRGIWRQVYEDDSLRLRKLPDGLDFKLVVDARPVTLVSTAEAQRTAPKDKKDKECTDTDASGRCKDKPKTLDDLMKAQSAASLKDAVTAGHALGDSSGSADDKKRAKPQVMIFSNGDISSFEVTLEREGGVRSVTVAQDDKGVVVAKPMVERTT